MKLTADQIKNVAKLSNLSLNEDEVEKYSQQLSKILEYIDQLNSVNTQNIETLFNTTGLENIIREDKVKTNLTQDEVLQNGKVKDQFFITKGVFEND